MAMQKRIRRTPDGYMRRSYGTPLCMGIGAGKAGGTQSMRPGSGGIIGRIISWDNFCSWAETLGG